VRVRVGLDVAVQRVLGLGAVALALVVDLFADGSSNDGRSTREEETMAGSEENLRRAA
jgi:hypothetical protein